MSKLILTRPTRLIHAPEVADNSIILTESAYTQAESGFLTKYPTYLFLQGDIITSLGGILELFANVLFENYNVNARNVYFSYWSYNPVDLVWYKLYGETLGTMAATSTASIILNTCQSMDYWNWLDLGSERLFGIFASCVEDAASVKASFRRITITENKGK